MHVIGTAGHVDHGKSTLVTRLTGIDPDRFEEEKRRGLTIDLGFAWLTLPSGREVGLVDVPGHERFIRNMLAGAGGITACLFVVAANEGWMPQSAEHLTALEVLGVSHGVVALTKSDTVDAETVELARMEAAEHLEGSCLEGAPIVACSGATGEGLDELVDALDAVLAAAPAPLDAGRPRLWIDRVFTISGAGTVVTGTSSGGSFAAGDEVETSPVSRRARIRTVQSHKKEVASIGPGNRVALNLAGLDRGAAARGDAVVRPGQWRPTNEVDAIVRIPAAHITGHGTELTEKGSHLLYAGSAETRVHVRLLEAEAVEPGGESFARLHLDHRLPLGRGDRFVLRDAGRVLTIGGGEVLDPLPVRARRGDDRHLDLLRDLSSGDAASSLAALVGHAGAIEADLAAFRSGAYAAVQPGGPLPDGVRRLGGLLVADRRHDELAATMHSLVTGFHAANPLEPGMPRERLRSKLGLPSDAFDELLDDFPGIVGEGAVVRAADHRVALDPQQQRRTAEILELLERGGFSPPAPAELDADPALMRALADQGKVVRVGDFYLSAERARQAQDIVRDAIRGRGPLTVAEIRDLLGTSRKYAVPLCEWLDETGITRRRGDVRILGAKA